MMGGWVQSWAGKSFTLLYPNAFLKTLKLQTLKFKEGELQTCMHVKSFIILYQNGFHKL